MPSYILQFLLIISLSICTTPNSILNKKNVKEIMNLSIAVADISVNISDIVVDLKSKTKTVSFNINITNWSECQNEFNSSVMVGTTDSFSDSDIMMRKVQLKGCVQKILKPFDLPTKEPPNELYMVVAIMKNNNIFSKTIIKIIDNPQDKPANALMLYAILFPTLIVVIAIVVGLWFGCNYYHKKKENPNQINLLI